MTRENKSDAIQKVESVEGGILKIVTIDGKKREIATRVEDTIFPDGAIESLFRRVSQVLSNYGGIVSNDPGWLDEIVKMSKYDTPQEAIPYLRNAGISAKEAARKVYSLMLNAGAQIDRDSQEIFVSALETDFLSLYTETTEVKVGIKK